MPDLTATQPPRRRQHAIALAVLAAVTAALFAIPRPATALWQEGSLVRAKVLSTDDSLLMEQGPILFGTQQLRVRLLQGPHKGVECDACNEMRAQLELDKHFRAGDIALVIVPQVFTPESRIALTVQQRYRAGWTYLLFGAFCLLLCLFGGWVGVKALLSFVFSCMVIWRAVHLRIFR